MGHIATAAVAVKDSSRLLEVAVWQWRSQQCLLAANLCDWAVWVRNLMP